MHRLDELGSSVGTFASARTRHAFRSSVIACGALLLGLLTGPALAVPMISEIRVDQPGDDTDEFFELAGQPGESLDGYDYLVIGDGDGLAGNSGVIEYWLPLLGLQIQEDGFLAVGNSSCMGTDVDGGVGFENSDNVTHLLVRGYTGLDFDVDLDDDGTIDNILWDEVVDCVALVEDPDGGDLVYCDTRVGPDRQHVLPIGKAKEYAPAYVARCGPEQWIIGNLYLSPLCQLDTPGAPNTTCDDVVPFIRELTIEPCMPYVGFAVEVRAEAIDFNDDIQSLRLFFRSGEGAYEAVPMAQQDAMTFTATIPPYAPGSLVDFYVEALDARGNRSLNPTSAEFHPRSYRVGVMTIPEVREQEVFEGDVCGTRSRYEGQVVTVSGVVTNLPGEFSDRFFFLQDGIGPFSGIRIYVPTEEWIPQLGDRVQLSGIVEEDRCQTQIRLLPGCWEVLGSDTVPIRPISGVDEIDREEFESMLVRVPGPITVVTNVVELPDSNSRGEHFVHRYFEIVDDIGWAMVGDETDYPDGIGHTVEVVPGLELAGLTGIVAGTRRTDVVEGTHQLEPRRDPDVLLASSDAPDVPQRIEAFRLDVARPNPAPVTTIGFSVARAG
ncbi:MAG: hypothetical protein KDA27_12840, partial [Candidatus Eisenbacteria bacterium]|nr:hypothetical protein [Candidatus Eisenbacteria bacterium]